MSPWSCGRPCSLRCNNRGASVELLETLRHIIERVDVPAPIMRWHSIRSIPARSPRTWRPQCTCTHLAGPACTTTKSWSTASRPRTSRPCCLSGVGGPPGRCRCSFQTTRCSSGGLTIGQRLMYLSTMTSYLNGAGSGGVHRGADRLLSTGVFPIHARLAGVLLLLHPVLRLLPGAFRRRRQPLRWTLARPADVVRALSYVDQGRRCPALPQRFSEGP